METYVKYDKPTSDNEYLSKIYEQVKSYDDSVIVNEGTDKECVFVRSIREGYFPITSVSREDFKAVGYDGSNLTDEEMEHLAEMMSDSYVGNGGYWDFLEYYAEENDLPTTDNEEDDEEDD